MRRETSTPDHKATTQPADSVIFTAQQKEITFSPNLNITDVVAEYWFRQVTLRLRREVLWNWKGASLVQHVSGEGSSSSAFSLLSNKTFEALSRNRDWIRKMNFFTTDPAACYLTEQLKTPSPERNAQLLRGSFEWTVKTLDLDATSCFILALGLSTSFDSAIENVIAACLDDTSRRLPSLSLVQKIWEEPDQILKIADVGHPLNRYGLLRYAGDKPTPIREICWDTPIEVPAIVAKQLLFPQLPLGNLLKEVSPTVEQPNAEADFVIVNESHVVAGRVEPEKLGKLQICPVYGDKHSAPVEVVRGVSKLTGRKIVSFRGDPRLLEDPNFFSSLATLCWLRGVDLFLDKDITSYLTRDRQLHNETRVVPLQTIPIAVFLAITEKSQLSGIPNQLLLPILNVPGLTFSERVNYWSSNLGESGEKIADVIPEVSHKFRYEKESIDAILHGLRNLGRPATRKDIVDACKAEMDLDLGELAQKVTPRFDQESLILPAKQMLQFEEIINAIKSIVTVHYKLGLAKAWNEAGVFIMFSGPSGTGKTMAAEILAAKSDMPMYKVDLSQLVDKYVGETEKKLKKLFDAGDAYDIILFFDEGDSIFGHRTEAKDAHDVYVNQQISYLLDRVDRFKGVAILATNRKRALDDAFTRRIRYIIDFPFPGEEERKKIWEQVIPDSMDKTEVDVDFLAKHFPLTGGNIRSIVFNVCLQSAIDLKTIDKPPNSEIKYKLKMEQIIIATRREYEKINRPISIDQFGAYAPLLKTIGYE